MILEIPGGAMAPLATPLTQALRMLQGKANHRACLPKVVLIFLLVGRCGISSVCVIGRRIGCPKSQIVTQKLHDQRRVLVAILIKGVQLGNGLIKGSLGELASLLGRVEDLVVEDGEVERQTEANRMRGLHLGLSNFKSFLVSLLRIFENSCSSVTHSHLGKVPEVIALHLQIKHLGLGITGLGNEVFVQKLEYVAANIVELLFNFLTILLGHSLFLFGTFGLLLN